MHCPDSAAYTFLAPGLLHLFGNLLLTIQGSALTLDANSLERTRQAVLGASDRGGRSLRVMRALLGEPMPQVVDAAAVLEQLVELCQVTLRERGQAIELRRPLSADARVPFGAFVTIAVECVRQLSSAVPEGVHGSLQVGLQQHPTSRQSALHCRFEPVVGTLPFPLATSAVADSLVRRFGELAVTGWCDHDAMGLVVHFAPLPAIRAQEA